jgi:hypothetical protein
MGIGIVVRHICPSQERFFTRRRAWLPPDRGGLLPWEYLTGQTLWTATRSNAFAKRKLDLGVMLGLNFASLEVTKWEDEGARQPR